MNQGVSNLITIRPGNTFVITDQIKDIVKRSLAYLEAGFPIHFSGPTGTGKSTLAFHVAGLLERPTVILYGNDEIGPSELLSSEKGFSRQKVFDNFIHSVVKVQEIVQHEWIDSRLINACKYGYTLIYDEFTRSRPETNNVLLSILEERMLSIPSGRNGSGYIKVHPNFSAIFTSNPKEYVGVHKTQDALMDRMISINLKEFDQETEIEIIMSHSSIYRKDVERLLNIVNEFKEKVDHKVEPSIRRLLMISKVMDVRGAKANKNDWIFRQICRDVLIDDFEDLSNGLQPKVKVGRLLDELIDKYCSDGAESPKEC
jgi:nitric oxide reductase NorQ protein